MNEQHCAACEEALLDERHVGWLDLIRRNRDGLTVTQDVYCNRVLRGGTCSRRLVAGAKPLRVKCPRKGCTKHCRMVNYNLARITRYAEAEARGEANKKKRQAAAQTAP